MKISSLKENYKILLCFLFFTLMIFGPVLSGGLSNSQDYTEILIPYSLEILAGFFFIFFISGFISKLFFQPLKSIIVLTFIAFCYCLSQFGNLILNRESNFTFILIAVPAGLFISRILTLEVIRNIIFNSSVFHGVAIIILALFGSLLLGLDMGFSDHYLSKINDGFFRSSGLFLNNNSLGSTYLLMMMFVLSTFEFNILKKMMVLIFLFIYLILLI